jgi:hypothetical protein
MRGAVFKVKIHTKSWCMQMSKRVTFLRLSEEDKRLLESLAKYYDIAEADVIRIALKEFAKNHGVVSS